MDEFEQLTLAQPGDFVVFAQPGAEKVAGTFVSADVEAREAVVITFSGPRTFTFPREVAK